MSLELLAQGVYVWLSDRPGHGHPNAGVVLDGDGATVVDTLCAPSQYEPFANEVDGLGFPIRRVVLTGDHIEFVGGTARFTTAAVFGSAATSDHLDQPPNPDVYRHLYPDLADQFDDELRTRPVTHVVAETSPITPAAVAVPTAGQSATNLVVLVPEASVLFAGAMAAFGVTPLAFDGDPAGWADALDELVDLAAVVVPGHGPIGGAEEVRDLQGYLRAVVAADGDPGRIGPGPWERWSSREWDVVNVERAAMIAAGDRSVPPSMLRAAGLA